MLLILSQSIPPWLNTEVGFQIHSLVSIPVRCHSHRRRELESQAAALVLAQCNSVGIGIEDSDPCLIEGSRQHQWQQPVNGPVHTVRCSVRSGFRKWCEARAILIKRNVRSRHGIHRLRSLLALLAPEFLQIWHWQWLGRQLVFGASSSNFSVLFLFLFSFLFFFSYFFFFLFLFLFFSFPFPSFETAW